MHAQEKAHAVARSMPEVAFVPPQRFTRQDIQVRPAGAFGKHGHGQVDMPFEHQRIVFPLQRGAGAQGHGTRNVRSTKQVLSAGVAQVQAAGFQQGRPFPRGGIVRQGRRRAIGRYGLETVSPVPGDLRPEAAQVAGGFPLVHGADMLLYPVKEPLHHQAVFQMGLPHAFYLHGILHGLAKRNGRRAFHHLRQLVAVVNGIAERQIEAGRVHADAVYAVFPQGGQGEVYVGIVTDGDAVRREFVKGIGRIRIRLCVDFLADEPGDIVQGYQQIGNDQRIIGDVRAAYVQQPGNLVQGGEENGIGPLLYQPLAQPLDAGLPAFTGEVLPQRNDGRARNGRPVFPQGAQKVRHRDDDGRWHLLLQLLHGADTLAKSVHGDEGFVHLQRCNPLRDGHLLRHTHLVKLNARSGKLLHGLDEVAGVCPQAGMVPGDHQVPGLSGEAGKPFHLFPAGSRIFAGMGIAAGKDNDIPVIFPHKGAKSLYAAIKDIFHTRNRMIFAQI